MFMRQFGGDDSANFGSAISLTDIRNEVYIGEPFAEHEQGLLYHWDPRGKKFNCHRSTLEQGHQRFGSNIMSTDLDGDQRTDLVVTSSHASQGSRLSGVVHIALTAIDH
ncbi:hypothetical protein BJ085DRAFT_39894 [Dimargaris cristalligena]|uniref:Integrin alpha N-terminal domain-containing protein n=1 Tax=Dimargaris cristalligena TaxID=215637 RepID=A0A4P9ZKC2_9FUNG|nr:hypothetical protein BJ085DRAFT_39894 [Dimargaris cristalligena]|eukprot:RKP33687.1 hypothetical protein BJ085DRAFT_39894 [Dimargaris cristalligena]